MNPQELICKLDTSFKAVKAPETWLHPECMDDMDIAAFYPFDDWQNIPEELLIYEYAGLSPASASAFQFLIPAYLRFCIRHAGSGHATIDSTLLAFQPDKTLFDFQVSKYEKLTKEQKDVILLVLEWLQQSEEEATSAKECMEILWCDS